MEFNFPDDVTVEQAQYIKFKQPEYNNNPLTQALHPILSYEQFNSITQNYPLFKDSECNDSIDDRFQYIRRLYSYFRPWDSHFILESKLSTTIRQGYISRNPWQSYSVTLTKLHKALIAGNSNFNDMKLPPAKASGFSIIGSSGTGKSTAVNKILSLFSQVIIHKNYKGKPFHHFQLVWLKLDCPFDGSVKGLCTNFLTEFGRIFGDESYNVLGRGTVDQMMVKMAILARRHHLGILVIDEIQALLNAKRTGAERMHKFFVNLVDNLGVPVVLIGTNKAKPILQGDFSPARRSEGQEGCFLWENLRKDQWWDIFMRGMWKYQWTRNKTELTAEIKGLFYKESQGIVDIAVKLFVLVQREAIFTKKEEITPALIKATSNRWLSLVKPMLTALRSGDPIKIIKYEDLTPIDIDKIIENQTKSYLNPKMDLAYNKSLETINDNLNIKKTRKTLKLKNSETKKVSTNERNEDKDDLKYIIDEGKKNNMNAYESLKNAGVIPKNAG